MTITVPKEPNWNLERRESSGLLVWQRDESKVRFRCEVEVLEYEKDPDEHRMMHEEISPVKITSTIVVCATCVAAVAVTFFLPWYLVASP